MFQRLQKRATRGTQGPAEDPTPHATPPAPETPPAPGDEPATPPAKPEDTPATPPATPDPAKAKKANPWKLMDEWKGKAAAAEAEIVKLKGMIPNEQEAKAQQERLSTMQKRVDELENEMRFVNYTKTKEFQEKYQKPYEEAWTRAASDLKEMTVVTEAGDSRPATVDDLFQIVNLPLAKAREVANQAFGDFADDVMAFRKEIRSQYDKQQAAIEDARTKAADREKEQTETTQKQHQELANTVKQHWDEFNQSASADEAVGKWFTPVEGDEEINGKLTKGYEIVDGAMAMNPFDSSLTPEQRAAAVRGHVAVRHRAAAFGRLVTELNRAQAKITELMEEKKKAIEGQPSVGGTHGEAAPAQLSAREAMHQRLAAKARPGY